MTSQHDSGNEFSIVVVSLLKGVVYADDDPKLWQNLLNVQARIRDYVREINLELVIYEDEGFAWLRTPINEGDDSGLPRLVGKRQLSYPVSLTLALLRRLLAEHDAQSGESRLIVGRDDIVEVVRTFLPAGSNDARIVDQIDTHINKIIEFGFMRRLRTEENRFEVRRILKAFVDAQWLTEFDRRLESYRIRNGGCAENRTDRDE